ncbi:phosphatase PAP2 family protein, partial [Streptomyces daliensis]|nr:phosphatase PAP2 family protein [Streptomyces daliensis]
ATGVALESRRWGAVVAPVAASVAFSRVYTGVHYPSDVLAGAALGFVAYGPRDGALRDVLEEAAQRALALGGALGVHGGDGSVNAAA